MLVTMPIAICAQSPDEEDPEIDVPLTEVESDEPYVYEDGIVIEVGDTIVSQHEFEEFVSRDWGKQIIRTKQAATDRIRNQNAGFL